MSEVDAGMISPVPFFVIINWRYRGRVPYVKIRETRREIFNNNKKVLVRKSLWNFLVSIRVQNEHVPTHFEIIVGWKMGLGSFRKRVHVHEAERTASRDEPEIRQCCKLPPSGIAIDGGIGVCGQCSANNYISRLSTYASLRLQKGVIL